MSEIVKWGLLVAAAVATIAIIVSLPFASYIDGTAFGQQVSILLSHVSGALMQARGLVNNFLSPLGRNILTGIMVYLLAKYFLLMVVKISSWIYHFIFK